MLRPPVALIFLVFAALGMVESGTILRPTGSLLLAFAVVSSILINASTTNDIADEQIDKLNLPGSPDRPLASGLARRAHLVCLGLVSGAGALALALAVGGALIWVVLLGLAFNLAYSVRPVRIAYRGLAAPLLLPIAYVVVPFLVGLVVARHHFGTHELALLGGLYSCFIGRIVLKDFRDAHGDRLCGKRTFLIRYGSTATCAFSATCWVLGAIVLAIAVPALAIPLALYLPAILFGLQRLSGAEGQREEQAFIWSLARIGMAIALTLLTLIQVSGEPLTFQACAAVIVGLPFAGLYLNGLASAHRPNRRSRAEKSSNAWLRAFSSKSGHSSGEKYSSA